MVNLRDRLRNATGTTAIQSNVTEPTTHSNPSETDAPSSEPAQDNTQLDIAELASMFGDAYTRHLEAFTQVDSEEMEDESDEDDDDEDDDEGEFDAETPQPEVTPEPVIEEENTEEPSIDPDFTVSSIIPNDATSYSSPESAEAPHMAIPDSILTIDTTGRFSGAEWYNAVKGARVTIVGCGGIGSYTAFLISRFNPQQIVLYDNDTVSLFNMAGQFFAIDDVGNKKCDAVAKRLADFSNYYKVFSIPSRFAYQDGITDIVISCLDNMESRKTLYETWKNHVLREPEDTRKHCMFIDGRLAAEEFQVFAVSGDSKANMIRYERSLFSDAEAMRDVCSYKQTSFMANMIGSVIANSFINHIAYVECHNIIREVPFLIEYSANTMFFKTTM